MTRSTANTDPTFTTPRLFVAAQLSEGAEFPASPNHAHYLATVLRRASGDVVRLFNGVDGEWTGRIRFDRRDRVTLTVQHRLRPQTVEAGPWLLFALLKRDATDLVVRQAVELGASRLLPVITERTNTARVNEDRLASIAIEAAEQSERLTVPVIDPAVRLDAALAAWPPNRRLFLALERSWANTPSRDKDRGEAALLIGPEGGFTPMERENLTRHEFITPISLGPFVLRAETAAVVGQALLLGTGWAEYVASDCNEPPESSSQPEPKQPS
jgi:16S rRNA (uracil1498-N3)-methyltransferase